jgi:predicted MFS family arabinose efflux permease
MTYSHQFSHDFDHQRPLNAIGILLCFVGILSIAFTISLRLIPNGIPVEQLLKLNVSPDILNKLNASYQYSLTACLIFSGLFIDIIGPRIILVAAVTVAVIANYLFAHSDSLNVILYSRILISYSFPFILTSVLTLGTHWLPRRHFSLFVGVLFGTLLLVPTFEFSYLQQISSLDELRNTILISNIVGILVVLVILSTAPIADLTRHRHTIKGMFRPLGYYKVWLISLVSMIGWFSNNFILHTASLFLIKDYHYTMMHADALVRTSFVYFSLGAILLGLFSDYYKQKRYLIIKGYVLGCIFYSIFAFIPHLTNHVVSIMLFLTTLCISSTIICYTKANDYCTIGNSGITLGLVLSITTIGSSYFVNMADHVLRANLFDDGVWFKALVSVPILLLIGAGISFMLKPTNLRAVGPHHPRGHLHSQATLDSSEIK